MGLGSGSDIICQQPWRECCTATIGEKRTLEVGVYTPGNGLCKQNAHQPLAMEAKHQRVSEHCHTTVVTSRMLKHESIRRTKRQVTAALLDSKAME